jgi:carbon-monoxide dehydrogenase large subunit
LIGRGAFVDDLTFPGLRHVAVVRSPHAHARIGSISAPASVEVITAKDLGEPVLLPGLVSNGSAALHPLLATERVCYVGQPVAVVLADTPYHAADAAEQVLVDYDPLPAVIDPEEALREDAPRVHPQLSSNLAKRVTWRRGASVREAARNAVTIEQRIRHQRLAAIPLETRGVIAVPPAGPDRTLTVWSSTQSAHGLRDELQKLTSEDDIGVRVIAPDVGGGFGAKGAIYSEEVLLPLLALKLGRPLKWVETRRENLLAMNHGRGQCADVRVTATRDGRMLALRLRIVADLGAYALSFTAEVPPLTVDMAQGPYDIANVQVDLLETYTNKVPTGPYRGAGRPEAAFYLERAVDILATELGLDPADVRRRNFIAPERFPFRAISGISYDSGQYARALDRALDASDYAGWRTRQARGRSEGRYIGIGLSSYVETCTYGEDRSRLQVDAQGKVTAFTGTSPHGQGGATGFAQIIADVLGLDPYAITVVHGDTALIPSGDGTAGSRTLVVGGSSLYRAAQSLKKKILERAAQHLEARVDDLVLTGGRVHVAGAPGRSVTLGALAARARGKRLSANGRYVVKESTFPFGTHVTVVEIDPDTGEVRLLQHTAVDDCGVVINPLLVEGQVHGGVAQAVGQALYEEAAYDPSGQPLAATLMDYAVPRATTLPAIVTLRTETPSPHNPLGAKGVGEAGTVGATPAVANAVIDALGAFGVRHLDMPLTPRTVWMAIQDATGRPRRAREPSAETQRSDS